MGGLVTALLLVNGMGAASDDCAEEPTWVGPGLQSVAQLKCLSPEELEQAYACGQGGSFPSGFGKGELLMLANTKRPKMKTRMANVVWKGKTFDDDGYFINQWAGFKALHSYAAEGPSWYDGLPCVVMEYPAGTPVFANMRDEIREVGPGVWLGMFFEREPCPKFRGFFALQCSPEKHKKRWRR
jgi:hypothetical protein